MKVRILYFAQVISQRNLDVKNKPLAGIAGQMIVARMKRQAMSWQVRPRMFEAAKARRSIGGSQARQIGDLPCRVVAQNARDQRRVDTVAGAFGFDATEYRHAEQG